MDASANAPGFILLQKSYTETSFYPVVYFSHKPNNTQLNYSVTDQEMLAIVEYLKHFYPYLHGTKFIIHNNH